MNFVRNLSRFIIPIALLLGLVAPAYAKDAPVGARKESLLEFRQKIASREATIKKRLETFRNKEKATIAIRVNTNLNKINANQTDSMKKHLTTMTAILDKLDARVSSGSSDIKDPAAASIAITTARTSIASASAAIDTQAAKDYTIDATSEANLKTEANAKRKALFTDLMNLRKLVVDAKQSVAAAIRTAKSGKVEKEASESGTE